MINDIFCLGRNGSWIDNTYHIHCKTADTRLVTYQRGGGEMMFSAGHILRKV